MSEIILVTGGARSGKSSFAEETAAACSKDVLYIATAEPFDDEMTERIRKHRATRPKDWKTLERFSEFKEIQHLDDFLNARAVLLDCLGLMLNNWMYYADINFENGDFNLFNAFEKDFLDEIENLFKICRENDKSLIIVTNEIGMGLVPVDAVSRLYRDILGRANKLSATMSDRVYLLVSGIPVKIK